VPDADVIDPVMRQRYRFSREGDVLRLELWADPGARVPDHLHPAIEERFEILEGELIFKVDGRKQTARPGDRLVAPAGTRHSFANPGPGVGHFVAEIDPGHRMQSFFEESAAMSRQGLFLRPGIPKGIRGLLAAAEFADRYRDIYVQTFPPPLLQRITMRPLARVARRRGIRGGREGSARARSPHPSERS
jgi:quercetin dioxygenase-like cupin family protein